MANTTWTQGAGMVSPTDTDNLESYADQAEASKDAAAVSAAAAEAAKVAAAASEAAALASKNSATTSATTATSGAATAAAKASEAAASATSASTSASEAQTAQTAAEAAETAAAASETASAASAAAASTSETNAATSASAASTSETNAEASETNAATSATASASSATASAASASAASASETAAAVSETAAAASEAAAGISETNAATSATSAATSATNAAASATSAATSESNAASSEASAAGSAASAASSYDDFDDRYLGAKASAPTLDNDGDPLITGALYFNTISGSMKVYDGSIWLDAYASLSGALLESGGTMTGDLFLNIDPTSALQAATKQYVDVIAAAGVHYHDPVRVESPVDLPSTYDNGTDGVGATLTNSGTQVALTVDGVTLSVNDRVLVYHQANSAHNGVYEVTDAGSASTNWVMTRAPDADTYAVSDPASLGQGDAFFVKEGATGAGELYVMNTAGAITFGTTGITFTQISSAAVYTAGTGVTLSGTQINIGQAVGTADSPTFAAISVTGNVDGRNVSADGTKLDTIETNADVTDTVNVTAAGALMDSEVTNLAQVKAFSSADYATAAQGALADSALQSGDNVSTLTNDAGYTTNVGDITGVTAGGGISGGGTSGTVTVSHADTSAQGSVNNSGATVIQDVTLDTYGHVTGLGSHTLTLADLGYTGATNANYITNNNQLTNGAGYTTNVGDITGVTAGNGLTGGGSSGSVTLSMSGSYTGNFTASGNVTAYSDERLKSNVQTIENAVDTVKKLRGVTFEKDGQNSLGVIAQEVQRVLPELVLEGEEYLSVAYGNMVGLLIEAIKEQQEQIETLKNEVK